MHCQFHRTISPYSLGPTHGFLLNVTLMLPYSRRFSLRLARERPDSVRHGSAAARDAAAAPVPLAKLPLQYQDVMKKPGVRLQPSEQTQHRAPPLLRLPTQERRNIELIFLHRIMHRHLASVGVERLLRPLAVG